MKKITNFAYYLRDFLTNYLIAEKGNSNNTVKSYSYTFLLLLKYMKEVKNRDADRISLEDYIFRSIPTHFRIETFQFQTES